jgi:hypothetical protein
MKATNNIDTQKINKIVKELTKAIKNRDADNACKLSCILSLINPVLFWDYALCNAGNLSILYHIYLYYKNHDKYIMQEFRNIQAEIIGLLCFPIKYNTKKCKEQHNFIAIMTEYYAHKKMHHVMHKMKQEELKSINTLTPEILTLVLSINTFYNLCS